VVGMWAQQRMKRTARGLWGGFGLGFGLVGPLVSFSMTGEVEGAQWKWGVFGEPTVGMQVFRGLSSSLADRACLDLK